MSIHIMETRTVRSVLSSVSSAESDTLPQKKKKFGMPTRKKSREQRLAERLLRGASKGALSEAKATIQEGAQVACFDENGSTPLHLACKAGHLDMIEMLIEQGAPVNTIGKSNYAPIHLAARGGHAQVIEKLHKSGAVLNIETKFEKRTSLHVASSLGWVDVVQALLDLQANPNKTDIYGSTPLQVACMAGQVDAVRLLLEYEANAAMADRDGWSALHFAAQNGHTELIPILLEGNAQIDAQTKYGRTPLHCACASKKITAVEALLSRGANITIKDAHGKTAMDTCKDTKVMQILSIFVQDNSPNFSQSMDHIPWHLPENKLMSMQSINVNTEPNMVKDKKYSRMTSSVPDFKSVGETDQRDGEDDAVGLTPQEKELFKIPHVEPLKKIYRKMLFTLKSLFNVLELRHDTMQKNVSAAIKSRSIAASTENVKEIHVELQSLKQNVEDFRIELPAELQTLVRCLHDFVQTVEGRMEKLKSASETDSSESSPKGPQRKKAVTVTGQPPSLNDLARELGEETGPGHINHMDVENNNATVKFMDEGNNDDSEANTHAEHLPLAKRVNSVLEEDAAEVAQHIRVFHHVSAILGRKKGTWKKMHFYLHRTLPDPITQATARGIEENYDSDSDRAFESLWAWFWQRQSATTQPLYVIIESLEHIGINTKHVEAIKALAAADNDNSTIASGMDSDSDTLSAGDSDDGYMDGIRVQGDGSDHDDEADDNDEAFDTFDTNKPMNENPGHKTMDHLTHLQKIKAQRKISSTPLHDYKNPSRILDPECIRGVIPPDKTKEPSSPSSSDLNHNNNSQCTNGFVPGSSTQNSTESTFSDCSNKSPSKVKPEVFNEEEENNVLVVDDAVNNVNGNNEDATEEGYITEQKRKISNDQKQRKNGAASNPFYMNGVRPGEKSCSSSAVDLHTENVLGERVTTPEREGAKQSLITISSWDHFTRIDSDPTCRSWSYSSEQDQLHTSQNEINDLAAISNEERRTPDVVDKQNNFQSTRRFEKEEMSSGQILSVSHSSNSLDSDSSFDQDRQIDDNDVFDDNKTFKVITLRPRTFTDTSTDDDETSRKVMGRIKRMKKSGGESTA